MADASDARATAETSKQREYDARLDFFSDRFDPLLALNTPGVEPPRTDAKVHDNLWAYEHAWNKQKQTTESAGETTKRVKTIEGGGQTFERKWLPHQLPVKSQFVPNHRNILKNMESVEGPMVLLKKCKDEKLKLKIWTRHSHGVRGYCIANIVAFDKHWNMALEDVTEVWTRPKRRKIPALENAVASLVLKPPKIIAPQIKVTPCEDKKLEKCERHVKQLLLRGEHVALVVLYSESVQKTK